MEEYFLEQITPTRKARISIGIQQVETTTGIRIRRKKNIQLQEDLHWDCIGTTTYTYPTAMHNNNNNIKLIKNITLAGTYYIS